MTPVMGSSRKLAALLPLWLGLGVCIVLTGCARHTAAPPPAINFDSGPLAVTLNPDSPKSLDKVRVNIVDSAAKSSTTPPKINVSLSMPSMDMGNNVITAIPDGSGKYHANVQFTMPGEWMVTVTVQGPNSVYDYSRSVTVR
jgi:hypothetical protein